MAPGPYPLFLVSASSVGAALTMIWALPAACEGCLGRCGEGWVEVFNVLTGEWGGKRDISQPVARGVVSVGRKAASLCVRDANLRRMS